MLFSCSVVSNSFAASWTAACQPFLSFPISWSFLKLVSIELVMPSHSLLPLSPPAFNLSQNQGLFQWVRSPLQTHLNKTTEGSTHFQVRLLDTSGSDKMRVWLNLQSINSDWGTVLDEAAYLTSEMLWKNVFLLLTITSHVLHKGIFSSFLNLFLNGGNCFTMLFWFLL